MLIDNIQLYEDDKSSNESSRFDGIIMRSAEDVNLSSPSCASSINGDLKYDKVCCVCGDLASGFHYSKPSCNGCKTFFRRTIVSGRKFYCRKDGNCQFDKNFRCTCRACRFKKCLNAGMKAQAIQYIPSANLTLSIARKRIQRQNTEQFIYKSILLDNQTELLNYIGEFLRLEEKCERLRISNFYPYDIHTNLQELLGKNTSFADAHKYIIVEKWPTRYPVNKLEYKKLGIKFWFFMDLFLGIDYLKTFEVFRQLTTVEQLIRSVVIANAHLSSGFYSYHQKADVTVYPDGSRPLQFIERNLTELEKKLRKGLVVQMSLLKMDRIQFALLRRIVLMNDGCQGISLKGQELLIQSRRKYTNLLLRYMQIKEGNLGAKKFSELMHFLPLLYRQTRIHYEYYTYKSFVLGDPDPSKLFNEIMQF